MFKTSIEEFTKPLPRLSHVGGSLQSPNVLTYEKTPHPGRQPEAKQGDTGRHPGRSTLPLSLFLWLVSSLLFLPAFGYKRFPEGHRKETGSHIQGKCSNGAQGVHSTVCPTVSPHAFPHRLIRMFKNGRVPEGNRKLDPTFPEGIPEG